MYIFYFNLVLESLSVASQDIYVKDFKSVHVRQNEQMVISIYSLGIPFE